MTLKPQSAEEPAFYEVKYETSDNANHTHTTLKRKKKANPELECSSTFLSREFKGRELPLLYGHVMKALPPPAHRI